MKPEMFTKLQIFVAYSSLDEGIEKAEEWPSGANLDVEIFPWRKDPGKELEREAREAIRRSDLFIPLITRRSLEKAMSVGQETDIAADDKRPIVPLVEEGVRLEELDIPGFKYIGLRTIGTTRVNNYVCVTPGKDMEFLTHQVRTALAPEWAKLPERQPQELLHDHTFDKALHIASMIAKAFASYLLPKNE